MGEGPTPDGGEPVSIPLDRLVLDADYQPRRHGLSESHVRLLMESDPQTWPPLLVAPNGDGTYGIRDGAHRCEAGRRLGLDWLPCVVDPNAGYPEAVAANLRHGLSLDMDSRKDGALWWLVEEPTLSDREIARRVGLSHPTVAKLRTAPNPTRVENATTRRASRTRAKHLSALDGMIDFMFEVEANADALQNVRSEIDDYHEADRADVCESLAAWGRLLLAAAGAYTTNREGGSVVID